MANLNKVFLMGNLTRDPELSYLPNQTAACKLGLAVNRRWHSPDGQLKEEVTFVDCSAYGRQAETLSKYLRKGRPVFLEGRLKLDQWQAQDGSKRSKMRVVVDNFQFIDSRGDAAAAGVDSAAGTAPARPAAPAAGRPGPNLHPAAPPDEAPLSPPDSSPAEAAAPDVAELKEGDIPF